VPQQTGYAGVMHIAVSVPRIPFLIDGVKYLEPTDVKPSNDATEQRRYRARGPSLRSLVKLALKCESAEQMGRQLKKRFDRSLRRRGIEPRRDRLADAELERLLGKPTNRNHH
jgi:hypothetical protein